VFCVFYAGVLCLLCNCFLCGVEVEDSTVVFQQPKAKTKKNSITQIKEELHHPNQRRSQRNNPNQRRSQ
jgi:hypothetical protein